MRALTPVEKWSYAIGNIPYAVKDTAFGSFVVFYYTQVLGLSGSLAGLAMFLALTWDGISDPLVGSWSDTLRSRWGRRHPMLVAGGLPTALLFLALFPPVMGLGQFGLFLWLLIVSILLRTFLTIYFIPYSAMGAELSTDYDERTVIAKARITVGWLSGVAITAVAYGLIFRTSGETDGRLVADNYMAYGILSTVMAGLSALVCVAGTRTVISRLPQAGTTDKPFGLRRTLEDMQVAWGNRNFRLKVGASLAFGMAGGVYATLSLYLGTYFWEFTSEQMAGLVIPAVLATLLAFVALHRLGLRFDKSHLLCAASLVMAVNGLWMIGARLLDLLPENGHPLIYTLMMVTSFIGVFMIVAIQVLTTSLLADVLDEQELATGERQEGVFFAASAFINKATTGLGALIAGVIIDIAGIEPATAPGTIPEQVLNLLGGFNAGIIFIFSILAYTFYKQINLGRKAHQQVQQQLARLQAEGLNDY